MAVTTIDRTRTQREREVENALASVRMEGLEISSEARAMFQQYVDDALSSEELDRAFNRYFDRKYDPYFSPERVSLEPSRYSPSRDSKRVRSGSHGSASPSA